MFRRAADYLHQRGLAGLAEQVNGLESGAERPSNATLTTWVSRAMFAVHAAGSGLRAKTGICARNTVLSSVSFDACSMGKWCQVIGCHTREPSARERRVLHYQGGEECVGY